MANKLTMAHERRKLQLKSMILGGRAQIATTQEKVKRAREELRSLSPKRGGGGADGSAALPGLRRVKIGG